MSVNEIDIYLKNNDNETMELGDDYYMVYDEKRNLTHVLNPIMAYLWNQCNGRQSVKDIIDGIPYEYDLTGVDYAVVHKDCVAAFSELADKNLIILKKIFFDNNRDF